MSIFFVSLLVRDHSSELYSAIEVTSAVKILILVLRDILFEHRDLFFFL